MGKLSECDRVRVLHETFKLDGFASELDPTVDPHLNAA